MEHDSDDEVLSKLEVAIDSVVHDTDTLRRRSIEAPAEEDVSLDAGYQQPQASEDEDEKELHGLAKKAKEIEGKAKKFFNITKEHQPWHVFDEAKREREREEKKERKKEREEKKRRKREHQKKEKGNEATPTSKRRSIPSPSSSSPSSSVGHIAESSASPTSSSQDVEDVSEESARESERKHENTEIEVIEEDVSKSLPLSPWSGSTSVSDFSDSEEASHPVEISSFADSEELTGDADVATDAQRARWNSRAEFLFAAIGYAVGIGNVWRFPYLCYAYGGGAFLVPYFLSLVLLAFPLFLMEILIGQMYQVSPIRAWNRVCMRAGGIGVAGAIVTFTIVTYYSILLSWSVVYMCYSFNPNGVPWHNAGPDPDKGAEYFFYRVVLNRSDGPQHLEGFQIYILIALVVSWIGVFFAIRKGVQVSGKVTVVTVCLPYAILVLLFFRGITLEGAWDGIYYYLKPDFSPAIFFDPEIWVAAAGQVIFSLSPCMGILITFGSYLDEKSPTFIDSLFVSVVNSFTSIFAGFVVFAVLGHMAFVKGVNVEDVAEKGPSLAFIVYPEALSLMPYPQLFAFLFFVTLLCLGLDSVFAWCEAVVATIHEMGPFRKFTLSRIAAPVCATMCMMSLLFATRAGLYWMDILDHFVSIPLMAIGVVELVVVGYLLGASKFRAKTREITGQTLRFPWNISWCVIGPVVMIALLIAQLVSEFTGRPVGDGAYPGWCIALGWATSVFPLVWIFLYPLYPLPDKTCILECWFVQLGHYHWLTGTGTREHVTRSSEEPVSSSLASQGKGFNGVQECKETSRGQLPPKTPEWCTGCECCSCCGLCPNHPLPPSACCEAGGACEQYCLSSLCNACCFSSVCMACRSSYGFGNCCGLYHATCCQGLLAALCCLCMPSSWTPCCCWCYSGRGRPTRHVLPGDNGGDTFGEDVVEIDEYHSGSDAEEVEDRSVEGVDVPMELINDLQDGRTSIHDLQRPSIDKVAS